MASIPERVESQRDKLMIAPAFPRVSLAICGNKQVSENESTFHVDEPCWGTDDLRERGH